MGGGKNSTGSLLLGVFTLESGVSTSAARADPDRSYLGAWGGGRELSPSMEAFVLGASSNPLSTTPTPLREEEGRD